MSHCLSLIFLWWCYAINFTAVLLATCTSLQTHFSVERKTQRKLQPLSVALTFSNGGTAWTTAAPSCNCGGGALAFPSASPRLALMGQQECTDKHRSGFTSAWVIRGSLWAVWFSDLQNARWWVVHSWHSWMIVDRSQGGITQRLVVISSTQHLICWSDSADITQRFYPTTVLRYESFNLGPVWSSGNKKQRVVSRQQVCCQVTDTEVLRPETACNNSTRIRQNISHLLQLTHFI